MADYTTHKTAVDLAYPTPAIAWYLHADDPRHNFDNFSVAYTAMISVEGNTKRYEAAVEGTTGRYQWRLHDVVDTEAGRGRGEVFTTWLLLMAKVASQWERDNESGRVRIATERTARDFLAGVGLVLETPPVADESTATLAGLALLSAPLTPGFEPDVLAYAFAAAHALFLPVATLSFAGQTVFWKLGREVEEGIRPVLSLLSGENIIEIAVVSQDGLHVKTYTLTVTLA